MADLEILLLLLSITFNGILLAFLIYQNSSTQKAKFKLKSILLSKVTHELRTPLHALIGLTQILEKESNLSEHIQRTVSSLKDNALYLLQMINNLLDMSKLESGSSIDTKVRFSLYEIWESLYSLFNFRFQEKGIRLTLELKNLELNHCFLGDSQKLKQILSNLISNALKFTDSGEVVLAIEKPNQQEDKKVLQIAFLVRDTGIGIPEKDLPFIFEPFRQGGEIPDQSGTGLGLSIVKQLVETLGGIVQVESKMGQGSTFSFFLPLTSTDEEPFPKATLPFHSSSPDKQIPNEEIQEVLFYFDSLSEQKQKEILGKIHLQKFAELLEDLKSPTAQDPLGKQILYGKIESKKTKFLLDFYQKFTKQNR